MLSINIGKPKKLEFDFRVSGGSPEEIKSRFVIQIGDGIELAFPGQVSSSSIVVEIPPLSEIIKEVYEKDEVEAYLEIIASDKYLVPWKERVVLVMPVNVQAEVRSLKKQGKQKRISESRRKKEITKEELLEFVVKNLGPTLLSSFQEEKKKKKSKKFSSLEEFKNNLTEEDILTYIAKKGTKNRAIQNLVLEQAKMFSKSDEPYEILKQVIKILKDQ